MKVLHLISTIGFFGAEKMVVLLSKELASLGCQPYIGIISNAESRCIRLTQEANKNKLIVKKFICNSRFDTKALFGIRDFIKSQDIDIIHSHGYKSNFYSILASYNLGLKRITTCHLWKGNGFKMDFYNNLDKFLLRKFNKVIAVSDILENEVLKNNVDKNKVTMIKNGIDIINFNGSAANINLRSSLGLNDGESIIGAIGVLSEEKGHIYLLRGFKEVTKQFMPAKLLIVGDGPLRANLEKEVRSLKLEGNVVFSGIRYDIPSLLKIMDIFVMPSLDEGMPMALLEAMAAKKPVVATSVGAIPKLIEHNRTGLLIEAKDADGIRVSIELLLKDKEKAGLLAHNAFEKVKNEFSSSIMAGKYLEVYKEVLRQERFN